MSEKPQGALDDEQEDLLEQIITHGLEKMNAPAQTANAEEAPAGETPRADRPADSGNAAPSTERNHKRSAVYLYLLILFGAAFMMLLLAYFIQRRSSESTISDLRDSMNLSREGLLDEIRELEGQIADLESEAEDWAARYSQMEEQAKQYERQSADLSAQYNDALARLSGWENFWALEQSYQAEDYESCIAILLLENMTEYGSSVPNGEIAGRREEIIQALTDRGLLPRDQPIKISDYQELIDRYRAEHPDHGPTGWANIIYD